MPISPSLSPAPLLRRATAADIPALLDLADILVEVDRVFDPSLDLRYNRSPEGIAWLHETLNDPNALVLVAIAPAATATTATPTAPTAAPTATVTAAPTATATPDAAPSTPLLPLCGMLFGCVAPAEPWRGGDSLLQAELEMLCVAPGARSTGVGKSLTDAFAAWAREHGAVRASVRVSAANSRAIRFYQRELFRDYDVVLERPLD